MDLGIDGNTTIVTASSKGLGKASANALAREGSNLVINSRNSDELQRTAEEISEKHGVEVVTVQGDITEKQTHQELIDTAKDNFQRIDHLVTSAGGPRSGSFIDISEQEWYDAFDLLVMSVVRLVKEAHKPLMNNGGSIVHITSRSVKEAIDQLVLSNSVRMSVIGLEKTLSSELAPDVRVNSVLPGPHETSRIKELIEQGVDRGDYSDYSEGLEEWSQGIPMDRIGDPGELGDVVAFLCSERASYINGAAIPVDGGSCESNL